MKAGLFRRIFSFILDLIPVIAVLSLCFQLFAGDLIKPENYDEFSTSYNQKIADYREEIQDDFDRYANGELSAEEYNEITAPIEASYFQTDETEKEVAVILQYYINVVLYYFIGVNVVYYIYTGFTKGRTIGRKIAKIELKGKVNWWTLLLRELLWKTLYWTITLGLGILVDILMIGNTRKKMAFRDSVSQIRVTYDGIDYTP